MDISLIQAALQTGRVILTPHAYQEAQAEAIPITDMRLSVMQNGELIEDYPADPRGASCLVLSFLANSRPIHTCWGYQATTTQAILITVYRPDGRPHKWSPDWRTRLKKQP